MFKLKNAIPKLPECTVHAQIDLKDVTIIVRDGTVPTPNEIEVKIGEGNLTFTEARTIDYTLDRQQLDEVSTGDEIPIAVTFDFIWDKIITGPYTDAAVTVHDAVKGVGGAVDWISTDDDQCRPYAVDLILDNVPDCAVGSESDTEEITLPDFRWDELNYDLTARSINCTGRCNATDALISRTAVS